MCVCVCVCECVCKGVWMRGLSSVLSLESLCPSPPIKSQIPPVPCLTNPYFKVTLANADVWMYTSASLLPRSKHTHTHTYIHTYTHTHTHTVTYLFGLHMICSQTGWGRNFTHHTNVAKSLLKDTAQSLQINSTKRLHSNIPDLTWQMILDPDPSQSTSTNIYYHSSTTAEFVSTYNWHKLQSTSMNFNWLITLHSQFTLFKKKKHN